MSASIFPPSPGDSPWEDAVFDESAALDRVGGDSDFLRELITLFLEECPGWLSEIDRSQKERSTSRLHLAAHTLKGALVQFFAAPAVAAAQELENVAGQGNMDLAWAAAIPLVQEMDRLQRCFTRYLEDHKSPEAAPEVQTS